MKKNCQQETTAFLHKILKYLIAMKVVFIITFLVCSQSFAYNSFGQNNMVLLSTSLSYRVMEDNLIVTVDETEYLPVTGIVKDDDGNPLEGVTIQEKGTQNGTTSGADGSFVINVQSSNSILVFSSAGFSSYELSLVNSSSNLLVTLSRSESANQLDNVVVIAYGTTTKKSSTGSLQKIEAKELRDIPVSQISQKLQGKLAGVQILQTSGRPGEGMNIRIRGQASVSAGNQPLFVVDGFPITGDISTLNPDEIEDITVLKDAASTSLYGSRAANGVVIVTTKRGKSGKLNIGVSTFMGIQKIPKRGLPDLMDAKEFTMFQREYLQENVVPSTASGYAAYIARVNYYNSVNLDSVGKGTNWFDLLTRTAPMQSYSISLAAGREKVNTAAVISFFNQQGVVINSGYKRFNARLNTDFKLHDKVKLGINLAPAFSINNTRLTDGGPFANGGMLTSSIVASPLAPAINADGSFPVTANSPGTLPTPNWYRVAQEADASLKFSSLISTAFLELNISRDWLFKTSINGELSERNYKNFIPSTSGNTNQSVPRPSADLNINNNSYFTWLLENNLFYNKTLGNHKFDAMAGFSAQRFKGDISNINATNFPNDVVRTLSAATSFNATSDVQEWSLISYLTKVGYSYKGKYLLNASFRRDGSSRFGSQNKWGNFPSISAGWIISDESFMKKTAFLSFAKLRTSFGEVGNNNIGNYSYYASVSSANGGTNNYTFNNILAPGNTITTLANSTLGWEKTRQFDFGIDLAFLRNRISFTYDYYNKITDGLLFNVPVPTYTGFSALLANIGKFKFWGHEFILSSINTTGKLKWNTDFNISFFQNKVMQLGTANASLGGGTSRNITKVGEPIGMLWGYVFNGIYKDLNDFNSSPRFQTSNVGSVKMKDVNGDGVITVDDRAIIGNPNPDFIFGLSNSFAYKNFDFSIVMAGSVGNDIMNTALEYTNNLDGVFNVTKDVDNRWRSEQNPGNGLVPRTLAGTTGLFRNANTLWVTDGSYLTVKNITLGYTLPTTAKVNIFSSARIYAGIQQALILTKYKGSNPEVNTGGNDPLQQGLDQGAYPVPRTYTLGLNVNF